MSFREKGIQCMSLLLKNEQNINIFDKNIYEYVSNKYDDEDDIEKNYIYCIYEVLSLIKEGNKLKDIINDIKNSNLEWKNKFYNDLMNEEIEQDNFIENPFEIEEGVLECKCGSKRVFSYQKQSRSADEPMSTYATCVACKNKWIYSG
jgi:DNA-directed RNA polymerase subunit M/transcription elongation factor TFIIS